MTPKQEAFARAYVETGNASEASILADVEMSMAAPTDGKAYVYFLLCPAMERVIYVGKGRNKRMYHHWRDVRRGAVSGVKKHKALADLMDSGKEPVPVVFSAGMSDANAYALERAMINRLGRKTLANTAAGQACPHEKGIELAKAALRKIVKVPPPGKEHIHTFIVTELNKVIDVCQQRKEAEQRC
jgi:hypothetical protein